MNNKIKMCSIDASTKKTGMAFFENGKLKTCGLLDFSTYTDREERLHLMCKEILQKLDENNPDIIWIEDSWNAANVDVTKLLTRIMGVTYGWCIIHDKEWHCSLPSSWRKYCNIEQGKKKRSELKQMSVEYVKSKYNIDVNDDVADAICIGLGAINYLNSI